MDEWNLFDSLDKFARQNRSIPTNQTVGDLFSSWSHQKGYPLLTVTRDPINNDLTLQQEHYLSTEATNETTTWWIPFNFAWARNASFNNTTPYDWISRNETQKTIIANERWNASEWVIFNKQQTSYYRVLYDEANYKLLAKQLNKDHNVIHVLNRAQLLDDLNEFVFSGRAKLSTLLDFLSYLQRETAYAPWFSAQRMLFRLGHRLAGTKHFEAFRKFIVNITETLYRSVGLDDLPNEEFMQKLLRSIVTNLACTFGNEECLSDTRLKFKNQLYGQTFRFKLRSVIFKQGIRSASTEELAILWQKLRYVQNDAELHLIASCFGLVSHIDILKDYLDRTLIFYSMPKHLLGSQWRWEMFRAASQNGQEALSVCIQLLHNQYDKMAKFYELHDANAILIELADLVATNQTRHEVSSLNEHKHGDTF